MGAASGSGMVKITKSYIVAADLHLTTQDTYTTDQLKQRMFQRSVIERRCIAVEISHFDCSKPLSRVQPCHHVP